MDIVKDVAGLIGRTLILYAVTVFTIRVMGKRSVGNLAPFDLAVIIMMGSVAALPMEEDKISIMRGIIPILILGMVQYLLSRINLASRKIEIFTQGTSTVLVHNGQIQEDNLKRERITRADLNIVLRQAGISNISEVEEAILEPTGQVSVIKKKESEPLTPKDLRYLVNTRLDMILQESRGRLRAELDRLRMEVDRRRVLRNKV